jgi:hypothetical protein
MPGNATNVTGQGVSFMSNHITTLAPKQLKLLEECETIIERGQKTFLEVGNALLQIKVEKLYLRDYETFDDYCRDRWGFERTYAHRLMKSAEVVENLLPIGNIPMPTTESQARPLASLPADKQADAWQDVVDECAESGEPITAAAVQQKVDQYKAQAEPYQDETQGDDDPPLSMSQRASSLDEIGDIDSPQGSRPWAIAVVGQARLAIEIAESDAKNAAKWIGLLRKHEAWKALGVASFGLLCAKRLKITEEEAEALATAKPYRKQSAALLHDAQEDDQSTDGPRPSGLALKSVSRLAYGLHATYCDFWQDIEGKKFNGERISVSIDGDHFVGKSIMKLEADIKELQVWLRDNFHTCEGCGEEIPHEGADCAKCGWRADGGDDADGDTEGDDDVH